MKQLKSIIYSILIVLLVFGGLDTYKPSIAQASGFIDFENGVDAVAISSSIPGLQFTTTQGYDWIYGDWRSGHYNGPYPSGDYYSNGNFFAWLGPNQGAGRIDFTEGCATYLQVWVSSQSGLFAEAYKSDGTMVASAYVSGNLDTGQLERLRVEVAPNQCINYVILHDTGNYWLIDDLSTDAGGVPATRPPVIILPGLTGSYLRNNDSCQNKDYEVWPSALEMFNNLLDPQLDHLKLQTDGIAPLSECDHIYPAGIIRYIDLGFITYEIYRPIEDYLRGMGYAVYTFDYDWRLNLVPIADQLDIFVDQVLAENNATKVNIVDHSLGGLLARQYVTSDINRAAKVEQVISVGTPFLGAPKALKALRWGDPGYPGWLWGAIGTYPPKIREISQNSPSVYQILPSHHYFDVYDTGYYRIDGVMQTWDETRSTIRGDHNSGLYDAAVAFHNDAMDDWGSVNTGVAFRLIVGSGKEDTVGVLNEDTVVEWNGNRIFTWDIEPTNGDGTVPIRSAALNGSGHDYSGGVPIWYTDGLDHLKLIQEPYVMQFIGAILATPPNPAVLNEASTAAHSVDKNSPALYYGAKDRFSAHNSLDTVPPPPPQMSTLPFPLNGGQIAAFRVLALHVYDEFGNHTGPLPAGTIELGIPGSGYDTIAGSVFVTVPSGGIYTTTVEADQHNDFDLRIRNLQGVDTQLIQRTIVYANVNANLAQLQYLPTDLGPAPQLLLDTNRDGAFDSSMLATGDLGPAESLDVLAPSININLDGEIGAHGWYIGDVTVTITATDDLSGIAALQYSLNLGDNIQSYTSPFIIHAEQVPLLVVRATDYAGNQGSERVMISGLKIFLPTIKH